MATAAININPVLTTNAAGSFNVSSTGYIQGTLLDNPPDLFRIAGGFLASDETIPMWGGVGIYELIAGNATDPYIGNATGPLSSLGGKVGRATSLSGATKSLAGFSIFNQAHGMINTPQSPVPLAGSYQSVNFVRLGSGVRIAVACDPVMMTYQGVDPTTQAVSWDLVNQILVPATGSINVGTGNTYNSGTGVVTLNLASNPGISPGDSVIVAGLTGTGSSNAIGTFTAGAGTTGTVLKYTIATGLSVTINDSAGTVTTGAAISVKVLDVNASNSMTVSYNATTGFATWNRTGATAVILI